MNTFMLRACQSVIIHITQAIRKHQECTPKSDNGEFARIKYEKANNRFNSLIESSFYEMANELLCKGVIDRECFDKLKKDENYRNAMRTSLREWKYIISNNMLSKEDIARCKADQEFRSILLAKAKEQMNTKIEELDKRLKRNDFFNSLPAYLLLFVISLFAMLALVFVIFIIMAFVKMIPN